MPVDELDDVGVTGPARAFGDRPIPRADGNRLVKASGGERQRVPEAVYPFRQVLAEEIVRRVTVIADRDGTMA